MELRVFIFQALKNEKRTLSDDPLLSRKKIFITYYADMSACHYKYTGQGLYTVSEASRISGMSSARIYSWLYGGNVLGELSRKRSSVLQHELPTIDHLAAISFRDLIQLRFLDFFRNNGLSLQALRRATRQASNLLDSPYPFCSARFKTDGQRLIAEVVETDGRITYIELDRMQHVFKSVVAPFLRSLDYAGDEYVARWWPLGRDTNIVVDPSRNFGKPTLFKEGIPTQIIYNTYVASKKSIGPVIDWFEISEQSAKAAVEYEKGLAA